MLTLRANHHKAHGVCIAYIILHTLPSIIELQAILNRKTAKQRRSEEVGIIFIHVMIYLKHTQSTMYSNCKQQWESYEKDTLRIALTFNPSQIDYATKEDDKMLNQPKTTTRAILNIVKSAIC